MAYTTHGYHMPGTLEGNMPSRKARCGGPEFCAKCSKETVAIVMLGSKIEPEILLGDNKANYQEKACDLVRKYVINNYIHGDVLIFDVYVVWFCKTLKNWKALVATTMDDGRYYEVTHNGEACETYLDAYAKIDNELISD